MRMCTTRGSTRDIVKIINPLHIKRDMSGILYERETSRDISDLRKINEATLVDTVFQNPNSLFTSHHRFARNESGVRIAMFRSGAIRSST